ncbi:uncharacterized protein M421DRAFT_420556 [Didymella exigua CBS 183.55]|uniref:PPPDE domain-containing protein n=1 Tax=Didymella exigua CBS 183.55 TaxID=1150837 RepID=A0A6A5RLK6_9PLEO|nr:uncharacterized protein M421DRAFT_420556 [Didymella exigua CBS 183.55]KAF1928672.1 hypothetical protein M421DRAFT_420556 [Didymella exigua CBS 183.55]
MGSDALSKLTRAGETAWKSFQTRWFDRKKGPPPDAELAEAIRQKNLYLRQIAAKITGNSESEVPPLICTPQAPGRAVFLITTPIAFGKLEVSKKTYDLLAKHVGMSMNSVSHWAVVVVDRSLGPTYTYDLMSDQLKVQMLMNNYFRVYEASEEFIASWSSCYYVGETLKSHEEIQYLGEGFIAANKRYNLLSNNCQHLTENLVRELCNGKMINQTKLEEEIRLISPKIARDLMVTRLRSKLEKEDQKEDSESVQNDVFTIKELWGRIKH